MATEQLDFQVDVPVNFSKEASKERKPEPPLTLLLHHAKLRMIQTASDVMNEYGIPAALMEGIISGVLADVRAQASADLLVDFKKHMIELERCNPKKEGEKLE